MSVNKIKNELKQLGSPAQARVLQRFFKTGPNDYGEGDRFRGIKIPVLRKLVTVYQDIPLAALQELLTSAFHEDRMLALLLLVARYAREGDAGKKHIFAMYLRNTRCINNWDLVDVTAPHIAGHYLVDKPRDPLYRLARSEMLWERRIAIIATFYYIRRSEFDDTLKITGMLIRDPHDLIHKAAGWMLREVGKRDPQAEERFLKTHYRQMPRTMLRYAIERFPETKRRAYLEGTMQA
jgi:3-methyladenine DNA glycosylase AlkD